jgi:hypothetical protein
MVPPVSVNHTFDPVVIDVPRPSLSPVVHVAEAPGPPGASPVPARAMAFGPAMTPTTQTTAAATQVHQRERRLGRATEVLIGASRGGAMTGVPGRCRHAAKARVFAAAPATVK